MVARLQAAWTHILAFVVALHLVAVTMLALPSPGGGLRRSAWKDPTVQAELRSWASRLSALGYDTDQTELEQRLWDLATGVESTRADVLAPFRPYYDYAGTFQSWRMFVAPHRYPARLHIDVFEDQAWRPVYVARSAEHTWRGAQLDHDRMRSALFRFAWKHYRRRFDGFAGWVADHAAVDFPGADKVRLRFFKARTPSPDEVRAGVVPEGEWVQSRVLDLVERRR